MNLDFDPLLNNLSEKLNIDKNILAKVFKDYFNKNNFENDGHAKDVYQYEKYVTDKENLKKTLEKFGVAIIPSVLDASECSKMLSGMWDYFEHITKLFPTPINRNDKNSYKEIYKLYPLHSMLVQYFSIGHAQVAWDVRQNEKIMDIFAYFWNCKKEDLLVSFDGLSFNMPPEITGRGWNRNNTWYHTDQSYTRNDFECFQSWVTALDVNDGDSTLAFMEGSHKFHEECAKKFNLSDKSNWHKLTEEEEQFYVDKGCSYRKIKCPKGSLVFWDSRTQHCGTEALNTRKNSNFRAVIYLCYMPRSLCDAKNLEKKKKAFNELRTTSHYPCKIKIFPKNPRTYGGELPQIFKICKPVLTGVGKRLAGF